MLRFFYVIILVFAPGALLAQVMSGTIADAESRSGIGSIMIKNKHTGVVVYSASKGHFSIPASQGDTLSLSHMSFETMLMVVFASVDTIFMSPLVYNLKASTVRGRTKYQQDSIERHELFHHELSRQPVPKPIYYGLGCAGCFGWLADKITGNSKKPKRFRKLFATEDDIKYIDTRYIPELVTSLTGISDGDSVAAFIYTYPMEYDFARHATDLELKAWIRNNHKHYLERKAGEGR